MNFFKKLFNKADKQPEQKQEIPEFLQKKLSEEKARIESNFVKELEMYSGLKFEEAFGNLFYDKGVLNAEIVGTKLRVYKCFKVAGFHLADERGMSISCFANNHDFLTLLVAAVYRQR